MNYLLKLFTISSLFTILCACSSSNSVGPSEKPKPTITPSQQPNQAVVQSEQPVQERSKLQGEQSKETKQENTIFSLIPKGWNISEKTKGTPVQATGDLNKDGIDDIAIIIEGEKGTKDQVPQRALVIAFGNGNNQYTFSMMAEKAILKANAGGIWGDPLEGISIDRGSILINFYGGSNDRWYEKYRFRFQDNDWYLIGATLGSFNSGKTTIENADEEDYNLLTGDFTLRKTDEHEQSKAITTKGNRGNVALLKLKDFDADGDKDQFLK
ncbi:hypothetical protein ACYEXS_35765 [Paenibacillus sp. MAH-36]|uniref:Uncharacterized protein n=1 Tax=Paenibacillus violae TaxID=3077234 RepID=A0ABU3RKT4_9BACL|nr:hypothetical protein [Paenibacillus sp. PFR10]MDU0204906.1 hypothetical protein [Paenibacillus sp. PFR10]